MPDSTAPSRSEESAPVPAVPLTTPRDGVPEVTTTESGLRELGRAMAAGEGPVAIDAERASGYRYGHRAYLVQFRRRGAGSALVDPVPLPDLSDLGRAIQSAEWVLHAASQDLPCLADLGLRPTRLFDTELAGRLLGRQRVGLGPLVESELGLLLEKGHAAADWSTRPLPEPWLRYAALDVEVLIELRDVLAAELDATGKAAWAEQEFAALATAPPPAPREDPWRRTSGLHRVRSRRGLAVVRGLWVARDRVARERDLSPGRVLPDAAIVAAAVAMPGSAAELAGLPGYAGRSQRGRIGTWWRAVSAAAALPEDRWPTTGHSGDGPPPARTWRERDPAAAARLVAARAGLAATAAEHDLPVENLIAPDIVRRLCWAPPTPANGSLQAEIRERVTRLGARPWQVDLAVGPLAAALAADGV